MSAFTEFLAILRSVVTWILERTADLVCTALLLLACVLPWRLSKVCSTMQDRDPGYRCWCLTEFCLAVVDIVCLAVGLLGALVPSRTCAFLWGTVRLVMASRTRGQHSIDRVMEELRWLWLGVFGNSVLDVPCLLLCLLSLAIPTRLIAVMRYTWARCGELQLVDRNGEVHLCNFPTEHQDSLRYLWITSLPKGMLEVVGLAFGLVAIASLLRSCQTVKEAQAAAKELSNWTQNDSFNERLLLVLLENGSAFIVDIIFLPLLLALALTVRRFPPALAAVRRRADWKARGIILRQTVFLLADLLLLLPAAAVLLTWYRSRPVRERLCRGQLGGTGGLHDPLLLAAHNTQQVANESCCVLVTPYHEAVLQASGLLLLDLLCLPLVLLVALIAGYRLPQVRAGLGPGTRFHETVCEQLCEALLDLPCLLAGLLVLCSVYRADAILALCRADAGSAMRRREEACLQLARLLRDVLVLCLAVPVAATLYRLPSLLLNLKAKLSRPLASGPEMRPRSLRVIAPRPSGRVGFRVWASKPPNLIGVTSMRLTVAGKGFWQAVERAPSLGPFMALLGRGLLPLRLRDGREASYRAVAYGQDETEFAVELEQRVKHSSITNFLSSLPPETRLVLQLEVDLATGSSTVLLAIACTIGACLRAVEAEDGVMPMGMVLGEEVRREVCSTVDEGPFRDRWWPLVLVELFRVLEDLFHLLLALLLLIAPWRFASAIRQVLEPAARRPARHVRRALVTLALWERACSRAAACLEVLANRHAKATLGITTEGLTRGPTSRRGLARQRRRRWREEDWEEGLECCIAALCCLMCPCFPNYTELQDADELDGTPRWGLDDRPTLARSLRAVGAALAGPCEQLLVSCLAWPEAPEWAPLATSVASWMRAQAECFYWLLLLPEWHVVVSQPSCGLSMEQHARSTEKLRARAAQAAVAQRSGVERLRARCATQCVAAEASRGCGPQIRKTCHAIVRESFVRALGDLGSLPALLLVALTFYRLPGLCRNLRDIPWDVEHFKEEVRRQVMGLAADVFTALQLLVLTALLIVTVVKFPDFVTGLQPTWGLRANRDWALMMLSELAVGIAELLLLLTCWKTYRLTVSAVVFAVLCPAAFLAVVLEVPCSSVCRFGAACALWLCLLAANLAPGLLAQLVTAGALGVTCAALCRGSNADGWIRPRGGMDWWSPIVRFTMPNVLSLSTVAVEGATLAWLAKGMVEEGDSDIFMAPAGYLVTAALSVVGLSVFLTALPVVADEEDQKSIIQHDVWRSVSFLVHEVLFLPVVTALVCPAASSWQHSIALLYFITIAVLSSQAWYVPISREVLLDIRSVGLCSSGGRLLLAAAAVAAAGAFRSAFLGLAGASLVWTAFWLLAGGASVAWAQVLRIGVGAGALAFVAGGCRAASWAWAGCFGTALAVGLQARAKRRRELLATDVPTAMARLQAIQARLSLWGDATRVPSVVDTSPQGAAVQLLELEERVPFERLSRAFLLGRRAWQERLLSDPSYKQVTEGLQELQAAITMPPTRSLLQGLLVRVTIAGRARSLPGPLAAEIADFLLHDSCPRFTVEAPVGLSQVAAGAPDLCLLARMARTEAQALAGAMQL